VRDSCGVGARLHRTVVRFMGGRATSGHKYSVEALWYAARCEPGGQGMGSGVFTDAIRLNAEPDLLRGNTRRSMHSWRICRLLALSALSIALAGNASAGSYSFTGTFTTDDQVQEFLFTVGSTSIVTAETFSYAGGTNQAVMTIPEGGFDPYLSIFDSSGELIGVNNDGTGIVPIDPVVDAGFDSYLSFSNGLAPGTYTLILSQSGNEPVGPTLADGFTETGQPDFTPGWYGCDTGPFCDPNVVNRTGNWAVDIDNVTSASEAGETPVPEPGSLVLFGTGIAGIIVLRRRWLKAARLVA